MQIADEKVVAFDYTLTDEDGEVIDSSEGREPLTYLHGTGGIIPGLEREMEGKCEGDSFKATIAPGDGYGEHMEELIQDVPREQFAGVDDIQVGMQFNAKTESGPMVFTVIEVTAESIQVDGNHPLAGEILNFDVTIREIRDATAEEIEHGHAHGPGGHDHG